MNPPFLSIPRNSRILLFGTGFLQVSLISANTWLVSHVLDLGVFMASFFISLVWSFNVTKVALGSWKDRIAYCFGTAFGAIAGMRIALFFAGKMNL